MPAWDGSGAGAGSPQLGSRLLAAALVAALASAPAGAARAQLVVEPEEGELGAAWRAAGDERRAAAPVHADGDGAGRGGAEQVLLDLAPVGGDVAALWVDARDGVPTLYLGSPSGGERALHPFAALDELDARLAASALAFAGIASWSATADGAPVAWTRAFGAGQTDAEPVLFVERADVPGPVDGVPLFATRDGRAGIAAWIGGGAAWCRRFEDGWTPAGRPVRLDPDGPPASGSAVAALGAGDEAIVAWEADGATRAWAYPPGGRARLVELGAGRPLALAAVPRGFWIALAESDRLRLVELDPTGAQTGEAPSIVGAVHDADLVAGPAGAWLALAVERAGDDGDPRTARGAIAVYLLDAGGTALWTPVRLPGPEGRGAGGVRLAPRLHGIVAAWTDRRGGDGDVTYRHVTLPASDAPEERWTRDRASADQRSVACASAAGHARVAWIDRRDGADALVTRSLDARGHAGPEIAVAPAARGTTRTLPALALLADGRFLAAWIESEQAAPEPAAPVALAADLPDAADDAVHDDGAHDDALDDDSVHDDAGEVPDEGAAASLVVRAFGVDGRPLGEPLRIDDVDLAAGAPALAPLVGDRGYVLVWTRPGTGPLAQRLTAGGRPADEPLRLARGSGEHAGRPAAARLADGRVAIVWDVRPPDAPASLAGRFVSTSGSLERDGFAVLHGGELGAREPALAAAAQGGFLLAWTSGAPVASDCVASHRDAQGRARGRPLALTTALGRQTRVTLAPLAGGAFVAAWEDDLSQERRIVGRRVAPWAMARAADALGPAVALDVPVEGALNPHAAAPRLVALDDGFAALWEDARRSRGIDVVARVLGPAFDD